MNTNSGSLAAQSTFDGTIGIVDDYSDALKKVSRGIGRVWKAGMTRLQREREDWERVASLTTRGARTQFEIAIALVSVIPLLALTWLSHGYEGPLVIDLSNPVHAVVVGASAALVLLGYSLLTKYPRTIVRIRHELEKLASGELPDFVQLEDREKDIAVLEECMNGVLEQTRERIQTIEEQNRKLAEAEKQKVMCESLAAACHHLGQPAMTLSIGLEMLKMYGVDEKPEAADTLQNCYQASSELNETLRKLQGLREYRTEPYLQRAEGDEDQFTSRILIVE